MLIKSVSITRPNERIVVVSAQKFNQVAGPGLNLVFLWPFKIFYKIDLDQKIPGWKSLSKEDIERIVREKFLESGFII